MRSPSVGISTVLLSLAMLAAPVLAGCGSTALRYEKGVLGMGVGAADAGRMLIRTASLKIEASDVAETAEKAAEIATGSGGYVERSSTTRDDRASLRLRVPSSDLDSIIETLAALGSEIQRQIGSRDVTEEVADLQATLKNKVAFRDRLRALLDRANTVEEVIQVEEHLTRLQAEIDSMEGRLERLEGEVRLAAIDLTIERGRILGPLGYLAYGLWWVFSKLFVIR